VAQARVLGFERPRHFDPALAALPITFPERAGREQLGAQHRRKGAGQHHDAILVALGFPHDDGVPVEIDILDAKAHGFHEAHARAVQQLREQGGRAFHAREHAHATSSFVSAQGMRLW
jgi:hypothetical protein